MKVLFSAILPRFIRYDFLSFSRDFFTAFHDAAAAASRLFLSHIQQAFQHARHLSGQHAAPPAPLPLMTAPEIRRRAPRREIFVFITDSRAAYTPPRRPFMPPRLRHISDLYAEPRHSATYAASDIRLLIACQPPPFTAADACAVAFCAAGR